MLFLLEGGIGKIDEIFRFGIIMFVLLIDWCFVGVLVFLFVEMMVLVEVCCVFKYDGFCVVYV